MSTIWSSQKDLSMVAADSCDSQLLVCCNTPAVTWCCNKNWLDKLGIFSTVFRGETSLEFRDSVSSTASSNMSSSSSMPFSNMSLPVSILLDSLLVRFFCSTVTMVCMMSAMFSLSQWLTAKAKS